MRWLIIAVVCSAALNMAGSGMFVWQSWAARQQNCDDVTAAFDAYTDALAEVTSADPETVAEFRAAYEPELANCH